MIDTYLDGDWFPGGIPGNILLGERTYVESAYCFTRFVSQREHGLIMHEGAGLYDGASLVVGPEGVVEVGAYTCLNAPYIICNERVSFGANVFVAWGAVITDTWIDCGTPVAVRRRIVEAAARNPARWVAIGGLCRPVVVGDAAWIGFDAVVLPGVTIGPCAIVGAKAVVSEDVPAWSIVAGNPAQVVRRLEPVEDFELMREKLVRESLGDSAWSR